MRQVLRAVLIFAALTMSACTVEDVKDARAGDSAAAAASKSPPATSAITPAPATAGTGATTTGSAVAPAPATPGATGADTSASPSGNNLAPDSVDVGRRGKTALAPQSRMRLEVDLTAKQLTAFDGDQKIATYRIAIGSREWPTQTGQWDVKQVVWNPEWIPPKEEQWAEDKDPKAPGAPDNPLGRAQLVYDPPRTVHGTNDPSSIGKAVSHGSIRMANADIIKLARRVMEVAGAPKDDSFYQQVAQNRTQKVIVDLPQRVPIRVF